jgi:putative Ca2+/H+ antiporter (TMEM165/GDT1 family)
MDWKVFLATFGTVFLAEMGDKTQLAALTMTAETRAPLSVLIGASLALFTATLIGVAVGGLISQWVAQEWIKRLAGAAFIVIGTIMFLGKW